MFKNFNYQHLLIGIIFVFIIFIFLSRENFYGWGDLMGIPTPKYSSAKETSPNKLLPTLTSANKICPSNSSLKNDNICEYLPNIYIPLYRPCPNNYEVAVPGRCRVINSTTSPKLKCDNGSVPVDGMCQSCPNNKKPENGLCGQECPFGALLLNDKCYSCDQGTLQGTTCVSY